MDEELDAIFAAWDKTEGEGRDELAVRSLSVAYVEAHPDLFETLRSFGDDQDRVIQSLETFRAAQYEREEKLVQVWLWATWNKQQVGGDLSVTLRVPGMFEESSNG